MTSENTILKAAIATEEKEHAADNEKRMVYVSFLGTFEAAAPDSAANRALDWSTNHAINTLDGEDYDDYQRYQNAVMAFIADGFKWTVAGEKDSLTIYTRVARDGSALVCADCPLGGWSELVAVASLDRIGPPAVPSGCGVDIS